MGDWCEKINAIIQGPAHACGSGPREAHITLVNPEKGRVLLRPILWHEWHESEQDASIFSESAQWAHVADAWQELLEHCARKVAESRTWAKTPKGGR